MIVPQTLTTTTVPRQPEAIPARPRSMAELGICATCNDVATCTGRATWSGPVFHCEEFDDRATVAAPAVELAAPAATPVGGLDIGARWQGLCVNCARREECALPGRREGGVWHCEEYA